MTTRLRSWVPTDGGVSEETLGRESSPRGNEEEDETGGPTTVNLSQKKKRKEMINLRLRQQ